MLDFVKKLMEQSTEIKERFYPAKAHEDGHTTSLSVLFIPDKHHTTVRVYNNRDILGECIVSVDLDPDSSEYHQQVGAAIVAAINS